MPPPTLANKAIEDAPSPKPVIYSVFKSKIIVSNPNPKSPSPTTDKPITVPPEKATDKASLIPVFAACAVLTLAFTATLIPT